jgi:hypothetical protein
MTCQGRRISLKFCHCKIPADRTPTVVGPRSALSVSGPSAVTEGLAMTVRPSNLRSLLRRRADCVIAGEVICHASTTAQVGPRRADRPG